MKLDRLFYMIALVIFTSIGCLLWVPVFPPNIRSAFVTVFAIGIIFAVLGAIAEYRKKVRRRVTASLILLLIALAMVTTTLFAKGRFDPLIVLFAFLAFLVAFFGLIVEAYVWFSQLMKHR